MHDSMNGSDGRLPNAGSAGGTPDARSALLALMVGSEDEFRRRAATRLAQLPAYRAVPADRLAIVLDEIAWLYQVFLDCLAERRELSPPEVGHIEGIGHSRARQGIPLEVLNSAFATVLDDSLSMLEDHARRLAAHDAGSLEVLPEFSRTLTSLALQTTQAMGRGHGIPDPSAEVPSGDAWIQQMMSARPTGCPDAEGPRDLPDLVIVLPLSPDVGLTAVLHELTATFGTALRGPIASAPVPHAVVLVDHDLDPSKAAARYDRIARRHHTVVVHGTIRDPGGIAECYRVMRHHLGVAAGRTTRPGALPLDELLATMVLATVPHDLADMFAWYVLGPLLATPRHDPLLATIQTLISTNGTLEHTAKSLRVTPKTVRTRLDTVASILGRPLDTVHSLARVRMALDLAGLHGGRWPAREPDRRHMHFDDDPSSP